MSAPKSLAGYPEWFFTIAERAMKQGYKEELAMTHSGAAVNLRQRFYKFRQLLVEAGHPHAPGAMSLTLTIHDKTLKFSQLGGLSDEAAAKLGLSETLAAAPASDPSRVFASDAAEAELEKMLGLKPRASAAGTASAETIAALRCPPHEWDMTKSFCLLCRRPFE